MDTYVDIIMPVYNTPKKDLNRCLNSIILQEYPYWKLYIVDDGSRNEISVFLDSIAKKDCRIYVYHIANSGVSNARNYGIEVSRSPYFCFIDSDDEFEKCFIKDALALAQTDNADLVIGGVTMRSEDVILEIFSASNKIRLSQKKQIVSLIDYMLSMTATDRNPFLNNIMAGKPYPKLYRRRVFHDVRFHPTLKVHEDNLYSCDIFLRANVVTITDKNYYFYWQMPYSVTHSKPSADIINTEKQFLSALLERSKDIEESSELFIAFTVRFCIIIGTILRNCCFLDFSKKEIKEILIEIFENQEIQKILSRSSKKKYLKLRKRISTFYYIVYQIVMIKNPDISIWILLIICVLYKQIIKYKRFIERKNK